MLDRSEYGLTGEGSVWHHAWDQELEDAATTGMGSTRSAAFGALAGGALLAFGLRRRGGFGLALAGLGAGLMLAPIAIRRRRRYHGPDLPRTDRR